MTSEQLRGAVEIIRRETVCDEQTAEHIARQMYDLWTNRIQIRDLKPGEIAQRFRKRYNA